MGDAVQWQSNTFSVCLQDADWNPVPAVYIFAGKNVKGEWFPLYVGETESLAERVPTHERWSEAERLGATHVHVLVVAQATARQSLEQELIAKYQPRLNVQHR